MQYLNYEVVVMGSGQAGPRLHSVYGSAWLPPLMVWTSYRRCSVAPGEHRMVARVLVAMATLARH